MSRRRHRLRPLLARALIVFAISMPGWVAPGCGGSSSSDSAYTVRASTTMAAASPMLSKARFVAQVNGICREAWGTIVDNWHVFSRVREAREKKAGLSLEERFEEAVRLSLLAGIDFHIFDSIHMLGSPKGEEEKIEAIIGPLQESVELGQLRHWRAHTVAEVAAQFSEYNELASAYGLNDCLVDEAHLSPIEA